MINANKRNTLQSMKTLNVLKKLLECHLYFLLCFSRHNNHVWLRQLTQNLILPKRIANLSSIDVRIDLVQEYKYKEQIIRRLPSFETAWDGYRTTWFRFLSQSMHWKLIWKLFWQIILDHIGRITGFERWRILCHFETCRKISYSQWERNHYNHRFKSFVYQTRCTKSWGRGMKQV